MASIQSTKQRMKYWDNIRRSLEQVMEYVELSVYDETILDTKEQEQLPKIIHSIEHLLLTVERAHVEAFSDYLVEKERDR